MVLSVLLLVARAAIVVPFSLVHNMMPHSEKLTRRDIIIVWWGWHMERTACARRASGLLFQMSCTAHDKRPPWGPWDHG